MNKRFLPATMLAAFVLLFALTMSGVWSSSEEPARRAIFAAGCFWCVEAVYEAIPGVQEATSGYTGGTDPEPTYEKVSRNQSDHLEAVEVTFDPTQVSYKTLLDYFWQIHDPTDQSGVHPDFGPAYRPAIFALDQEQRQQAEESKRQLELSGKFDRPVITPIEDATEFFVAEDYHQNFVRRNLGHPYVRAHALPKLDKLGLAKP